MVEKIGFLRADEAQQAATTTWSQLEKLKTSTMQTFLGKIEDFGMIASAFIKLNCEQNEERVHMIADLSFDIDELEHYIETARELRSLLSPEAVSCSLNIGQIQFIRDYIFRTKGLDKAEQMNVRLAVATYMNTLVLSPAQNSVQHLVDATHTKLQLKTERS